MSLALMNEIRELKKRVTRLEEYENLLVSRVSFLEERVAALETAVQQVIDPLARHASPEPPKKPDTLTLDKRKA